MGRRREWEKKRRGSLLQCQYASEEERATNDVVGRVDPPMPNACSSHSSSAASATARFFLGSEASVSVVMEAWH
jgi:hypothetical protein